jgi:predicted permease
MNGFGIDVDDDHKMILQNMELFMEDTIDQGVDGMVQVEAPMQMVTLIL